MLLFLYLISSLCILVRANRPRVGSPHVALLQVTKDWRSGPAILDDQLQNVSITAVSPSNVSLASSSSEEVSSQDPTRPQDGRNPEAEAIAILDMVAQGGLGTMKHSSASQSSHYADQPFNVQTPGGSVPVGFYGRSEGLLLELHIPQTTLESLHERAPHKHLVEFLALLQNHLCKATNVATNRMQMIGVHGAYSRPAVNWAKPVKEIEPGSEAEEVIVRFMVKPRMHEDEVSGDKALEHLQTDLQSNSSVIIQGKLGKLLKRATVMPAYRSVRSNTMNDNALATKHVVTAMAIPFGVSALFTGIIVSFAAA